jgi:Zn-dependent oligopeptidase
VAILRMGRTVPEAVDRSEVLEVDAFLAFKETNLLDLDTAMAFRTNILEGRGSEDPEKLLLRFQGRPPSAEPIPQRMAAFGCQAL